MAMPESIYLWVPRYVGGSSSPGALLDVKICILLSGPHGGAMSLCDPVHDELAPRRVCLWACRGAHTLLVAANVGKNGTGDCARDSHSQTRTKKESSKEISMMPLGPLGERGNQAHDHSQPRKHSFYSRTLYTAGRSPQTADPPSKDHGWPSPCFQTCSIYTKYFTIKYPGTTEHERQFMYCLAYL